MSSPTIVGTAPFKSIVRTVEAEVNGRPAEFYSIAGAAAKIGCDPALVSRMATHGNVRILLSADGLTRMILGEDVEAIAAARRKKK